jgi:PPOX class probable F420-dependent enzyme
VTSITDPEVHAFLTEGTRTGKLGYVSSSGRALVAPVWFIVEDGELVFNTGKNSVKGRSLARDPRATMVVDLEQEPYGFVQVQGTAALSHDPAELQRTATAISARYVGPGRAEEFVRRNGGPGGLVVRVRPDKVIAYFNMTARPRTGRQRSDSPRR